MHRLGYVTLTDARRADSVVAMATPAVRTRRWTRVEYERLVDLGVFKPGERLELLDGLLVVREPQSASHSATIRAVEEALRTAFGTGWDVRVQLPIALDDESEPEPDIAVVPGSYRDYHREHPTRAVLVVEVAGASLAYDRRHKGVAYARAGIPEYWIVNRVDDVVEVYRAPAAPEVARVGWAYSDVQRLEHGDVVSPLAAPAARIAVSDLLP